MSRVLRTIYSKEMYIVRYADDARIFINKSAEKIFHAVKGYLKNQSGTEKKLICDKRIRTNENEDRLTENKAASKRDTAESQWKNNHEL